MHTWAVDMVILECFNKIVLPEINAGTTELTVIKRGKFQADITKINPSGTCSIERSNPGLSVILSGAKTVSAILHK